MNVKSVAIFGCRLNCGTPDFTPSWIIFLASPAERVFDSVMAALTSPKILQMKMTPEEVGKACALYVAARCKVAMPSGGKVRMDYYFDRDGKVFAGARARVEVL